MTLLVVGEGVGALGHFDELGRLEGQPGIPALALVHDVGATSQRLGASVDHGSAGAAGDLGIQEGVREGGEDFHDSSLLGGLTNLLLPQALGDVHPLASLDHQFSHVVRNPDDVGAVVQLDTLHCDAP